MSASASTINTRATPPPSPRLGSRSTVLARTRLRGRLEPQCHSQSEADALGLGGAPTVTCGQVPCPLVEQGGERPGRLGNAMSVHPGSRSVEQFELSRHGPPGPRSHKMIWTWSGVGAARRARRTMLAKQSCWPLRFAPTTSNGLYGRRAWSPPGRQRRSSSRVGRNLPARVTLGTADSTLSEDRIGLSHPRHALQSHFSVLITPQGRQSRPRARLGGCEPVAAAASPGGPIALGCSAVSTREGDEPISSPHSAVTAVCVAADGDRPGATTAATVDLGHAGGNERRRPSVGYAASCQLRSPPSSVCVR